MSSVRIEICADPTSQSIGCSGTKSDKKSKYEERRPRRRHGTAKRESSIPEEGHDHYDSSTVHLAQRTEEQRPEYVADQEDGYGKGILLLISDVKIICCIKDGSTWKRRGNG